MFTVRLHISGCLYIAVAVALQLAASLPVCAGNDTYLFKSGFSSYNKSDYSAAISSLTAVLEKYPDTLLKDTIILLLARSHLQTGNSKAAAILAERLLQEFPDRHSAGTLDKDLAAALAEHRTKSNEQAKPTAPNPAIGALVTQPNSEKDRNNPDVRNVSEPTDREQLAWEKIVRKTEAAEKAGRESSSRTAAEHAERKRLAKAKEDQERSDLERLERKRKDAEKSERERLAQVRADKERREAEQAAADKADLERLAMLRTEEKRRTAEREELEKIIAEKRFNARLKTEQAERERAAAEYASIRRADKPALEIIDSAPRRMPLTEPEESIAVLSSKMEVSGLASAAEPAEKVRQASFELSLVGNRLRAESGRSVTIPFTITNRSSAIDRYRLESGLPAEFSVRFADAANSEVAIEKTPPVPAGKTFKGVITVTVPGTSSDGSTCVSPVKVFSLAEAGSYMLRDLHLTTSSPLLRALIKPKASLVAPGEKVSYAITVINAGSAIAGDVTLRLACPPSFQAVDLGGTDFRPAKGELVLDGFKLAPGEIRDISITFQVNDAATREEEYYCRADLVDNRLQTRLSFLSGRLPARK